MKLREQVKILLEVEKNGKFFKFAESKYHFVIKFENTTKTTASEKSVTVSMKKNVLRWRTKCDNKTLWPAYYMFFGNVDDIDKMNVVYFEDKNKPKNYENSMYWFLKAVEESNLVEFSKF